MTELNTHTSSVEVQFSGNAKTYHYLITAVQWAVLADPDFQGRDMRVVTPGKVKDGRLSTSVANVIGVQATAHPSAVLPILAVVTPEYIALATQAVIDAEAKAAAAADALGAAQ